MPATLPPATVSQEQLADYELPSGMIERERQFWLVPVRSAPREPAPCAEAKGDEIVVCGRPDDDPARDRLGAAIPDAPTAMEELKQKMHVKVGPGELAAGGNPSMVGLTYRIKF